jgi:competence protein ComGC
MKPRRSNSRNSAITLVEVLLIIVVLGVLAAVLLAALAKNHRRTSRIGCTSNLKEIGLSYRIWGPYQIDKYPFQVSTNEGGSKELAESGDAIATFQVLTNDLSTPRVLICPEDTEHVCATNFESLSAKNVSYFVGLDADETLPQNLLSGDDNLVVNDKPVKPGILNLMTNEVTWTTARHHSAGNVLLDDGSVQSATRIGFTSSPGTYYATNRLVIP